MNRLLFINSYIGFLFLQSLFEYQSEIPFITYHLSSRPILSSRSTRVLILGFCHLQKKAITKFFQSDTLSSMVMISKKSLVLFYKIGGEIASLKF